MTILHYCTFIHFFKYIVILIDYFAKKTQNIWSFHRKALYLHLVIIDFNANEFS